MNKTIEVNISELKHAFDVRQAINEDYSLQLAVMVEEGVDFQPITITDKYEVVDGRHRIEAHKLADKQTIKATIIPSGNKKDLYIQAFKCNLGGSMPPTKPDILHTCRRLLELGMSESQVAAVLPFPRAVASRYSHEAACHLRQTNIRRAVTLIGDGAVTVKAAAVKFNVPLERLQTVISGKKAKVTLLREKQVSLTNQYTAQSRKNSALFKQLCQRYDEADVSADEIIKLIDHMSQLVNRQANAVQDFRIRFEQIKASSESPLQNESRLRAV